MGEQDIAFPKETPKESMQVVAVGCKVAQFLIERKLAVAQACMHVPHQPLHGVQLANVK